MALTPDPSPHWQLILTGPTSADRTPVTTIGELIGARDRQFNFTLNRAKTLSFTLPMKAPHATDILLQPDGLLLLTYDGAVRMVTEIQTVETVGEEDERSIAVTASETLSVRLAKAIVGQSTAGLQGPTTLTDQGTFLNTVLNNYNTATVSGISQHTWIGTTGTITASNTIKGGAWPYKPLLELIQELGASTSGFDYWQTPTDPRTGTVGTAKTGDLNIAPIKGTTKDHAVFEYGTASPNAQSYRFLIDNVNRATRFIGLPPSFPSNVGLSPAIAFANTVATASGVREELVSSDLNDQTLRQNLVVNYKDVKKDPRKIFTIQPLPQLNTGRVPRFYTDYGTGDIVRGRVVDGGLTLIDALVRVYGVQVSLTDEGMQTDVLTLVQES